MKRKTRRRLRARALYAVLLAAVLVGGLVYWRTGHETGSPSASGSTQLVAYTVEPGDSLSGIAGRYGTSVAAIASVNGIANPNIVVVGSRLLIPQAAALPSLPAVRQGTQRLISTYARQYGVPPAFALAVAWQESGFNQSMVSRTGAIGVMQVEPDTGVTIGNFLGRPVDLHLVRDNVQAGVYLLARLDASYSGNQRLAAAAYYQGARSVSRDGLYRDTRRYVDDVMALEARFGG